MPRLGPDPAELRKAADLIEESWPDEVGAQQTIVDLRRHAAELEALDAGIRCHVCGAPARGHVFAEGCVAFYCDEHRPENDEGPPE